MLINMPTSVPPYDYVPIYASIASGVLSLIAILISLYVQYHTRKKTTFINVITSERIRWMEQLRQNVSDLSGQINKYSYQRSIVDEEGNYIGIQMPEYLIFRKEFYKYIMLIRLLLNPNDPVHSPILEHLVLIKRHFNCGESEKLSTDACDLVEMTQTLLKETWEIVKQEALEGLFVNKKSRNRWLPQQSVNFPTSHSSH